MIPTNPIQWNRIEFQDFRLFLDEFIQVVESDIVKQMSCSAIMWNNFYSRSSQSDRERMLNWKSRMTAPNELSHEEAQLIADFVMALISENISMDITEYWIAESAMLFSLVKEADDYRGIVKVVKELREEYHAPKPIINAKTNDVHGMINKAQAIKAKQKKK